MTRLSKVPPPKPNSICFALPTVILYMRFLQCSSRATVKCIVYFSSIAVLWDWNLLQRLWRQHTEKMSCLMSVWCAFAVHLFVCYRMFALQRMKDASAHITTSEALMLMLCRDAAHPKFKEIQKLIWDPAPDSGLLSHSVNDSTPVWYDIIRTTVYVFAFLSVSALTQSIRLLIDGRIAIYNLRKICV